MTDVNVTNVPVEHWLVTDPDARTTIVVVEHWMSVAEGTPVVPDTQGPRVMVLA
jgi:hypothetical protein